MSKINKDKAKWRCEDCGREFYPKNGQTPPLCPKCGSDLCFKIEPNLEDLPDDVVIPPEDPDDFDY